MNAKRWIWIATGVALLVAGGWAGLTLGGETDADGWAASGWMDTPASEVEFEGLDGAPVSIRDHAGEVILLNFWGTWCPPCRKEIPELVELQDHFEGRGATVVGIAVDSGHPEDIRSFADEFGVNYPIWVSGARKALSYYDAIGYPFTVLIDREGIIRKQYLGPQSFQTLAQDMEVFVQGSAAEGD